MSKRSFDSTGHSLAGTAGLRSAVGRFVRAYVFSTDHKVIGIQFLFSSLVWLAVGGLLALAVRWQLAWPWSNIPFLGNALFASNGGQITPGFYNTLFTMHATIMIFFVVIPILTGAFSNYLIPLMIGSPQMAFPRLGLVSYWLMWPAFFCVIAMLFVPGYGASAGWTSYPPLSVLKGATPTQTAQSLWALAILFTSVSSMVGAINFLTSIVQMRAPGMTMFRLPMTVWAMLVTALMQAFALPVLVAALLMLLSDQLLQTGFFLTSGISANNNGAAAGGGQVLLWQHLFWFYSHPAVYIMILPAMGMVSDMLACFSRKPLFGYRSMVFAMLSISGLGFVVWGHHMFVSGMARMLAVSFMVSTMLIALPSGIKVFNWIATMWGGRLHLTTPMLFCVGFVLMFVVGGLSGLVMASPPVNIVVHDTYYIVAHLHYVLFGASVLGVFASIYYWYPKMFGRMMSDRVGKAHFLLTFVFLNGTFFPMHFLGPMPRRLADPYVYDSLKGLLPLNQFITMCALAMGVAQLLFVGNFFFSLRWGKSASRNPWRANSLEWTTASPPPRNNFQQLPIVKRDPYQFSHPERDEDFWPQSDNQ